MPTYQYRCDVCSHEFEEFQAMADDPIEICPKCGGKVHRLISGGVGLIFRGTGFYITDYKRAGEKKSDSSDSSSSSSSSTPASSPAPTNPIPKKND